MVIVLKSIHTPKVSILCKRLRDLREECSMTQRDLAKKLKVPQTTVARMELGERRVDVAEFHTILEILEVNPEKEFRAIALEFSSLSDNGK